MGTILRVTELAVRGHPDAVVRARPIGGVVIDARTEPVEVEGPSDFEIEWSGDLGLTPDINGGRLETSFAPGAHTVTATGHAGGSSVTVRVWQGEAEVVNGPGFAMTDEPRMPVITARVQIIGPVAPTFDWTCRVRFAGADDCSNLPHFGTINDDLEVTQAGGDQFTPSFDKVRGRSVVFTVRMTIGGRTEEDSTFAAISGTNPPRSEVQAALPHDTLRRIACRESGQRQFDAPADGGVSGCPLFSSDLRGRVGILQVPDPTPDHVWNWRLNVAKGTDLFQEKVDAARAYPSHVRNSEEFARLVAQFNQRRQGQGLNPLQVVLPEFTTGNFDDNVQQLELDAVRGYDGWYGADRFGLELHEFSVAVERIDGEEVLVVTNVNEDTLQGEAVWERVPDADRPDQGAPNYVEEVFAFLSGCSSAPAPTCPTISDIIIDPSDTRTHEIPSRLPPPSLRHLVTVKGTGDIVLRATIIPDTPQLRSQLTWEAGGAVITSPALGVNSLTAKISRNTPGGARIPVRLKIGTQPCTEVVVWIISCMLMPQTNPNGISSITGTPLGPQGGRGVAPTPQGPFPGYFPAARIEWTATIEPAAIITDPDRPAIEAQQRVAPPGSDRGVAGFPGPNNLDATGSGFSGWDMSRQRRQRVFKGNPDKVPPATPEPITETTPNDPEIEDRPLAYPTNDVEGNDDTRGVQDEDSNPYERPGIPGQGTTGTLRSTDRPEVPFLDVHDHSGNVPGEEGDTYRLRNQFREFVRVQLGSTWYRCSDFGLWRHHVNAKRLQGRWNVEPGLPDRFDATNNGF